MFGGRKREINRPPRGRVPTTSRGDHDSGRTASLDVFFRRLYLIGFKQRIRRWTVTGELISVLAKE
jgi:hypothetical protein